MKAFTLRWFQHKSDTLVMYTFDLQWDKRLLWPVLTLKIAARTVAKYREMRSDNDHLLTPRSLLRWPRVHASRCRRSRDHETWYYRSQVSRNTIHRNNGIMTPCIDDLLILKVDAVRSQRATWMNHGPSYWLLKMHLTRYIQRTVNEFSVIWVDISHS